MALNPHSPLPLYQQLVNQLKRDIRDGRYGVGEKIPSENEMASHYAIGRPTVRQATDTLVRDGLLERRRGSGTFVCPSPKRIDLFSLMGTSAALADSQLDFSQTMLAAPTLTNVFDAAPNNPFVGQRAYCLSRLSCVAGQPVLLEDMYLHADLFHGLEQHNLAEESLSRLARESFHLEPVEADQAFQIEAVNGARAQALEVADGSVLLKVSRRIHFSGVRDAVYSDIYCRTDQFQFSQCITAVPQGAQHP